MCMAPSPFSVFKHSKTWIHHFKLITIDESLLLYKCRLGVYFHWSQFGRKTSSFPVIGKFSNLMVYATLSTLVKGKYFENTWVLLLSLRSLTNCPAQKLPIYSGDNKRLYVNWQIRVCAGTVFVYLLPNKLYRYVTTSVSLF